MTNKLSEEEIMLASQLCDGGIPLDEEALEGVQAACHRLSIFQTATCRETRIFDLDSGGMGLMVSLAISNDSRRNLWLQEFRVDIPWWEPHFQWLEDPARKAPREFSYSFPPLGPTGFERDIVLNHRRRRNGFLGPGDSMEGLLLGVGQEPIPGNYRDCQPLDLRVWVFDQRGNRFGAGIRFLVERRGQVRREKKLAQQAQRQGVSRLSRWRGEVASSI